MNAGEPLHIVAPPGSGKTLVGLLLAVRRGERAVVFAPTTTIARQWVVQARAIAPAPNMVSEDADALAELTVTTYQRISTTERSGAFDALAFEAWVIELVEAGRDDHNARRWLDSLAETNPDAYRKGIAKRARRARKDLAKLSGAELSRGLHPNARELVDGLVEHGVTTIVLDECHHLLDHWALVIAYLEARIREAGRAPTLIGLTATAPSPQDSNGYENYSALLGEVDFEQPTPVIVQEKNLAPYRDLVWFTEPTRQEKQFLARQDELLNALIVNTLGRQDGIASLERILLGGGDASALHDAEADPDGAMVAPLVAQAFSADWALASAASSLLQTVSPNHPLIPLLPAPNDLIGDAEIRVLARFLMEDVLPDASRAADFSRARALLADFGYALSDRGIRRARDPIDTLLASSAAKDRAVADILYGESTDGIGANLRAVVVGDFARHGNRAGDRGAVAGVLRTFSTIVADDRLVSLMPILNTSRHLRIAIRDVSTIIPRLASLTGVTAEIANADDDPNIVELSLPGVTTARAVAAVSALLTSGYVRVVVGTRGLLGEGWDCPAANTLIDLTTASTSSATQQLRGRTLRLDPLWEEKVAHNWTVTTVIPGSPVATSRSDLHRLNRKLAVLWGVSADGAPVITRGAEVALRATQRDALHAVLAGRAGIEALATPLSAVESRSRTRDRWAEVAPFTGVVRREVVMQTKASPHALLVPAIYSEALVRISYSSIGVGVALAGVGVFGFMSGVELIGFGTLAAGMATAIVGGRGATAAARITRKRRQPTLAHAEIADVIAQTLRASGAIRSGEPTVIGDGNTYRIELAGASGKDAEVFRAAMRELYSPVQAPRFLLEISDESVHGPLARMAARISKRASPTGSFLAVPTQIGRRAETAEQFAVLWRTKIGGATLHALASPEAAELVIAARKQPALALLAPASADVWS